MIWRRGKMADLQWVLDDIEASPAGPHIAAFFDFDGTLISGYSAAEFFKAKLRSRQMSLRELFGTLYEKAYMDYRGGDVSRLMNIAMRALTGRSMADLDAFGEDLFRRKIVNLIFEGAPTLIEAHRARGHTLVIASSATPPQIMPAARHLQVPHVLATQMEVEDGVITGRLLGTIKWGQGKAAAVEEFAQGHGIDLAESFAYANGAEDVAFLETVGRPRPTNPVRRLAAVARARGWRSIRLYKPKRRRYWSLRRRA